MARKCTICESKHLKAIDKSLVDNDSIRAIAERYDMTVGSVFRHKTNHLPVLLMKAKAIEEVTAADSLLDQAQNLLVVARRLMKRAEDDGAIDTALRGVAQIRGVLELLGEVRGELNGKGTTVNVAIQFGENKPPSLWTDAELDAHWHRNNSALGVVEGVSVDREPVTIEGKLLT